MSELEAIRSIVGAAPETCAWWSFYDPDVRAVLDAYDWDEGGQLSEWWGDDPPYWLVLGVAYYRRALAKVRVETDKQTRPKRAPRADVEMEIED